MSDLMLSPHMSLREMTRTEVRQYMVENQSEAEHNAAVLSCLKDLCLSIVEPVRLKFGPVEVHSGFRMPLLNAAVGGQPGSQHQLGQAVDFHISGMNTPEGLRVVFDWIRLESGLKYGQVILEGRPARWVHLSLGEPYRDPRKCRQALVAVPDGKGGMRYERVS